MSAAPAGRARAVYLVLVVLGAFASATAFALVAVYRVEVAGLDAFQLVLAGTVMEAAILVFEVPTGLVADLVSRRGSIIVGHVGIGAAFLLEAAAPSVVGVLAAQALWGVAYTFTSGATVAWLAGELSADGDDAVDRGELGAVLLRGSRYATVAGLGGLVAALALASWNLRAPLVLAGAVQVVLGIVLVARMTEHGFAPVDRAGRSAARTAWATFASGVRSIRRSRALTAMAILTLVTAGASEAFDRYEQPILLDAAGVAPVDGIGRVALGRDAVLLLGAVAIGGAVLGIVVPLLAERRAVARDAVRLRRWLVTSVIAEMFALVVFAAVGWWAGPAVALFAAGAAVVVRRARSLRATLFASWVVPLTPRSERATVLSSYGQLDAVSQVAIGPVFGAVGRAAGLPWAVVLSAVALVPAMPVVRRGFAERSDRARP